MLVCDSEHPVIHQGAGRNVNSVFLVLERLSSIEGYSEQIKLAVIIVTTVTSVVMGSGCFYRFRHCKLQYH